MRRAAGLLLALALMAAPPRAERLKLGVAFPLAAVPDAAGNPVRLTDYKNKQHILLLASPHPVPSPADLKELETVLVVLRPERGVLEPLGAWDETCNCPLPTTLLIDKTGLLRWMERGKSNDAAAGLVRLVRQWERGKWSYDSHCARCHGADGNDTGYAPNIKKLGGLGNHLTPAGILDATAAAGVVSFAGWSRDDLDALAMYVAGL